MCQQLFEVSLYPQDFFFFVHFRKIFLYDRIYSLKTPSLEININFWSVVLFRYLYRSQVCLWNSAIWWNSTRIWYLFKQQEIVYQSKQCLHQIRIIFGIHGSLSPQSQSTPRQTGSHTQAFIMNESMNGQTLWMILDLLMAREAWIDIGRDFRGLFRLSSTTRDELGCGKRGIGDSVERSSPEYSGD